MDVNGGGGFGSGRYRFKNRFCLVVIINSDFNEKQHKQFNSDLKLRNCYYLSQFPFKYSRSQPMLSIFSRVTGDAQSLMCAISFSVV